MGKYYPVYIDLNDKKTLVVGGGKVAERKVKKLLSAGAKVFVVSPALTEGLKTLHKNKKISYTDNPFSLGHLKDIFLVICAADCTETNSWVSREAKQKNILVNIVDVPDECNFIVPAIVERGDLIISISTSGSSPALAKKIRREMEENFGDEYAVFLEIMREMRNSIVSSFPTHEIRNTVFNEIVNSPSIFAHIKEKNQDKAREEIQKIVTRGKV